jgi:hypothetical protein
VKGDGSAPRQDAEPDHLGCAAAPRGEAANRTGSAGKRRMTMASTLVVLKFDTPDGAE